MIHIPSETALLKRLIVHTPGPEVSHVNPEIKDELLFDDIIFESDAKQEHLDMLDVFQAAMGKDGKIYEIRDLVAEVLAIDEAKAFFVTSLIKLLPEHNLGPVEKQLLALTPEQLTTFAIVGHVTEFPHVQMHPSPNLLFTRDLAAFVGNTVVVSRAAKKARIRESLMMETLIKFHPMFVSVRDNAIYVNEHASIEGGDILVASEKVVLIGMSERTSFSALHLVTEELLDKGIEHVIAVDIPKQRSSMHLDTIFTFTSENECLVFPPSITEKQKNVVVLSKKDGAVVSESKENLKLALEEYLGREFTFINCGGEERTSQFREQWTDGANCFAIAPGVIVGYERNTKTFEALKEHGYEIMNQFEFVEAYKDTGIPANHSKKIAIHFMGHELCRGRGGARCMTMPFHRI